MIGGQLIADLLGRVGALVTSRSDPGTKYVRLTASASDIANYTALKGLRVYNATDGAGLTVLGAGEATGDTPHEINYRVGVTIEPYQVRRVTVIDSGIEVDAIF